MGFAIKKRIKLLIIATTRFDLDGITNVILNYYRTMDKSNMKIDFVIPNKIRKDLEEELTIGGSNIYRIKERNKNPIRYFKKLKNTIKKNRYDIVHAHGNSCTLALEMYAAKKGGAKVRIPHSHNTTTKHRILNALLRNIFEANYTHAFSCGQLAGEWLYKDKSFKIMNNGIEVEKFKYNQCTRRLYREKYNLKGKKVVGHIGHFSYQKNHEYLVKIFSELYMLDDDYRLLLIGDGKLKTKIENMVNELELNESVIFMGKTLEVPELLQVMDCLVMPSRFEGLPLTLVEAQSASLPCFVSDVVSKEVGITELVNFISLDKSPKEWAKIIHTADNVIRSEIKEQKAKKIKEAGFSIIDNAKEMRTLYQRYVEQG